MKKKFSISHVIRNCDLPKLTSKLTLLLKDTPIHRILVTALCFDSSYVFIAAIENIYKTFYYIRSSSVFSATARSLYYKKIKLNSCECIFQFDFYTIIKPLLINV